MLETNSVQLSQYGITAEADGRSISSIRETLFIRELILHGFGILNPSTHETLLKMYEEAGRPMIVGLYPEARLQAWLLAQTQENPADPLSPTLYKEIGLSINPEWFNDRLLVQEERFIHGVIHKKEIIEDINHRYRTFMYTVAFRRVRDWHYRGEAEDVVQDAFVKMLVQKNPQWPEDPDEERTYVCRFIESVIWDRTRPAADRKHKEPVHHLSEKVKGARAERGNPLTYEETIAFSGHYIKSAEETALEKLEPSIEVFSEEKQTRMAALDFGPRKERKTVEQLAALSGKSYGQVRGIVQRWKNGQHVTL